MRYRIVLLVAALAWLRTPSAQATPNFPTATQSYLMLGSAPPCTLCHLTDLGGQGTVRTPFGVNMIARGLVPFDAASLENALRLMTDNGVISAAGCRTDIEELKAGGDPNHPTKTEPCADAGAPVDAGTVPDAGGPRDAGDSDPADSAVSDSGMTEIPPNGDVPSPPVAQYGCRGNSISHSTAPFGHGHSIVALACCALAVLRRRGSRVGPHPERS